MIREPAPPRHYARPARAGAFLIVLLAWSCGTTTADAPADRDEAGTESVTLVELLPEKARFSPGEPVQLTARLAAGEARYDGPLTLRVYHLAELVHEETRAITLEAGAEAEEKFVWNPPPQDFTGYLAAVTAGGTPQTTGVDISSSPFRFPRYGFLSEFSAAVGAEEREERVRVLAQRYLIDLLQFYDWQWRHDKLIKDDAGGIAATWTDLFGRETSWGTVQGFVDAAHRYNVAAMAYVMIYAAREGYAELFPISPGWGIFRAPQAQNQISFSYGSASASEPGGGVFLFLFDPGNPAWQDWMTSQYVDAIRRGNFDGVHIDQLGPIYDVYRADSTPVSLPGTFPPFLRATDERLEAEVPERSACVFNIVDGAVGGWAVEEVATANACDFQYSELWFTTNTYRDVQRYVEVLRLLSGGAAVVLAAYSQYGEEVGETLEAEDALRREGVTVAANHPGHTGAGFVDGFDAPGDSITWEVSLAEAQTVTLVFRYANATGRTATRRLLVDGEEVTRLSFGSHDQWSMWRAEPYFQVELGAGRHEVTLAFAPDDSTAINVDHLRLSSFDDTAVRLADAVVFASGATHIELGDDEQSLAHEYYPNRSKALTPELKRALRRYYSFAAAYENVLFGADVVPVSQVPAGLSLPSGQPLSDSGAGVIYPIVRRRPGMEIVHLVNLMGAGDDLWRNAEVAPPDPQEDVRVRWRAPEGVEVLSAFWASPDVDGGVPHDLEVARGRDDGGAWVDVVLPRLDYWDMIVFRTRTGAASP